MLLFCKISFMNFCNDFFIRSTKSELQWYLPRFQFSKCVKFSWQMWLRQWGQRNILAIQSDMSCLHFQSIFLETTCGRITALPNDVICNGDLSADTWLHVFTVWCVEYMIHIEKSTFMSKCKAQCIEKSFMCSRCIVDYKYRAQNKRRQFAAIIFLFHMAEVWRSKKVHFGRNIRTINCQCTRNWSILSKINPVPEEHRRKSGAVLLTKIWNGFFIFYLFSINENSFFCDREETDRDDFLDA